MGIATQLGNRIGAELGNVVTGERKRMDEDRSLQQQIALLRESGGPDTPAGAEIFNQIQQHPAYQQLSQRMGKTFSVKDFQASDPALQIRQQAVDVQKEVARARQIREISDAMVNIKEQYRTTKGNKVLYDGLDADESYKQMSSMLGKLLVGDAQGQPQEQNGQPAQPQRTADLFVAPKHDPLAYEPSPGEKPAKTAKPSGQTELSRKAPMMENWWLSGWKGMGTTGKGPATGNEEGGDLDPLTKLADSFVEGQSNRKKAVAQGKAVVPNAIDATDTTPKPMAAVGITDPYQQKEFSELEAMVGKAVPDMDLRTMYKQYPKAFSMLMGAIQKGIPDGKGGTRKLTMQEIVKAIRQMGQ